MTDDELAAIAARVDAAAPGPWTLRKGDMQTIVGTDPPGYRVTRMLATDEDAAFIIHAREDIPALLAEVERLREIGRALAAHTPEHSDYSGYYGCQFCHAERRDEPPYNLTPAQWRAWLTHTDDCPVTKARVALAANDEVTL